MFSFFKPKKTIAVPPWAAPFAANEYEEFTKAIESYFKKLNIPYQLGDGVIKIDENIFGFDTLGLMNVAQTCKQHKVEKYKDIIWSYFDSAIKAHKFDTEFKKISGDFESVKDYVGVRLYPISYIAEIKENGTLGKNISEDLYAMLVFDLPDGITNIKPEIANKWGKSFNDLFAIGLHNIKKKYPISLSKQDFGKFNIWFAQGDHFFVPNIIFDLQNHPELLGTKGTLVCVPHRHAALIYPIENLEVVDAINGLIFTAHGMHREGPGSLVNNLFLFADNLFENLPYKLDAKAVHFTPPETFIELLNSLSKKPDSPSDK